MELRQVSPITKTEAKSYAVEILETKINCKVQEVSYIGGGSFGYVYKLTADKEPYNFILKACRTPNMAESEAAALLFARERQSNKNAESIFYFFRY